MESELHAFKESVAARSIEDFYRYELDEMQDFSTL